ncbi:MAG: hypothetical protein BYD32DRAFT_415339 [Podila humilis]|nr:MAG: hypothetical protein BYD32DRAFT_415339 [Podila humilis]
MIASRKSQKKKGCNQPLFFKSPLLFFSQLILFWSAVQTRSLFSWLFVFVLGVQYKPPYCSLSVSNRTRMNDHCNSTP